MKRTYSKKTWYTPRQIAQLRLIQNSKGERSTEASNYNYVLELIRTGRLRAKNYANGKRPFWMVPEDEIARYHDTVTKVDL